MWKWLKNAQKAVGIDPPFTYEKIELDEYSFEPKDDMTTQELALFFNTWGPQHGRTVVRQPRGKPIDDRIARHFVPFDKTKL